VAGPALSCTLLRPEAPLEGLLFTPQILGPILPHSRCAEGSWGDKNELDRPQVLCGVSSHDEMEHWGAHEENGSGED
jgi:hypothetical protein